MRNTENWTMTPRRWEVLGGIGAGMSNAEIGRRLFISESTVKTHVHIMLKILGFRHRNELMAYCYQEGLLPVREREEDSWVVPDDLMAAVFQVFEALRKGDVDNAQRLAQRYAHRISPSRTAASPRDRRQRPEPQPSQPRP